MPAPETGRPWRGADRRGSSFLGQGSRPNNPNRPPLQSPRYDRHAVRRHVQLLHDLGQECSGVLLVTPIWEGASPRPQRFRIGDASAMADAVMAFEDVSGVNLYAQYGTMRRDLPPGR